MGWETALGMISSRGKTAPGPGRCRKKKTTEKEPGMGSTDLVSTAGTIPPVLCAGVLLQSQGKLQLCCWSTVRYPWQRGAAPSLQLCLKQQGWSWGAAQPPCNCQVFVFWDFSPVSDGDKGTQSPGFAAALLHCGGCVRSDRCQGDAF